MPNTVARIFNEQPCHFGVEASDRSAYLLNKTQHALGQLVAQNIDDSNGKNTHDALKKLQTDSGVECDITHTDVPGFGVLVGRHCDQHGLKYQLAQCG